MLGHIHSIWLLICFVSLGNLTKRTTMIWNCKALGQDYVKTNYYGFSTW
jgi:hypothetical protein